MKSEELKSYLQSLNIVAEGNENASKIITGKEYSGFFLTSSGVGAKNLSLIRELLFGKFNFWFFRIYLLKYFFFSHKERLKKDKYLIVHNFWSGGYHHWLAEALLKLAVSEINYEDYTLLLPKEYPAFTSESLTKFKFSAIVYLKPKNLYYINNAVILSNPVSGFFCNRHIEKLREMYVAKKYSKPFRKIYVSRINERSRMVTNEKEVYGALLDNGYEIVETQKISFNEQVAMFAEASEVISIHGAALTNMIFMQPGTRVVELYRELTYGDKMNLCYYRLADAASLAYECHFLKVAAEHHDIDHSDLSIDVSDFISVLTPKQSNL
ncbi:hypothetical protein BEL04_07095 [Mucilaginibacter sp. PPCGB 2223]|uniref:glycosyltransferase family 61 protein n=1 Tax=Mucilaginibacter sp. PPCGB 2223 TaxID=1886027 RepID=UPI000824A70A|nr:glycosyltransferase family 61 protein [Mucilaginibacter sp. PPCGB 2223]OCX54033.1 hypothetical protein BEL04_07095 [Mucilaginibacter sp. PPCGB 2223]